ncbi:MULTISPECIES: SIMPL domain-containing protein [Thiomicrorhabdus]|uniref:SIMPL domain-containing protein n=1 Tax=Thiomicrorhabdus heinhorstiae TaxID=2748010 RepID=A0ABS0BT47_9GAMM|nr:MULTISPECIES: SIMPL domain-containing protein [Thiomicrorhabdus]MBF6057022.1 SIMPL domain-containing protein [Thiomicrorhabdus heinhorstiae]
MQVNSKFNALVLGISLVVGLGLLGWLLGKATIDFKSFDRIVTVKGLAEKEVKADVVIWPIRFSIADNNLETLYKTLDSNTGKIVEFLESSGIAKSDISFSSPSITDKLAQQYGNQNRAQFRYTATQNVTVYSKDIDLVRTLQSRLSSLGQQGIVITGGNYEARTEYLFTGLNDIKPGMIEEATRNAREVAEKFAKDSSSVLGKIKSASQGQFSIISRDNNTPYIKKVRVVSTITYYLSD